MRRQQEVIKTEISGATIRSTSKRRSAMKVLMFLDRKNMPHTITEISEELDMNWSTVKHNLLKLMDCEFVEIVEDKMDTRTRYFQVVNKEATDYSGRDQGMFLWRKEPGYIPPEEEKMEVKEQNSENEKIEPEIEVI